MVESEDAGAVGEPPGGAGGEGGDGEPEVVVSVRSFMI